MCTVSQTFLLDNVNAIYIQGQLPDHKEDTNRINEASFRGSLPGNGPEVSSAINKSVGMSASDKASHSRFTKLSKKCAFKN